MSGSGTRRRIRWLRVIGVGVVVTFGVWLSGLTWFAGDIPRRAPQLAGDVDAIVVLTGGSGRLRVGLDLLQAGDGRMLFVSGVYRGVDVAELLRLSQAAPAELECCIALGYSADDTRGNAVETAQWMAERSFASLRLVTANYHMRRSLFEFTRAMPDATIIPHPVPSPNVHLADWWSWPGSARLIAVEYTKYLAAVARAGVFGF